DKHAAKGEKFGEQSRKDHGIGDVGDRELVEAQKFRFREQGGGHRRNRIGLPRIALLELHAMCVDTAMHIRHELVEMHPALPFDLRLAEEHFHQHGLAAADTAMDVEAANMLRLAAASCEHPAEC